MKTNYTKIANELFKRNIKNGRSELAGVVLNDNKQIIIDGLVAFRFKKHIEELDELPKATRDITFGNVWNNYYYTDITAEDLFILKNLKEYKKIYQRIYFDKNNKKPSNICVKFANEYFDVNILKYLYEVNKSNLDTLKIGYKNWKLQAYNDEVDSAIMGYRYNEENEDNEILIQSIKELKELKEQK